MARTALDSLLWHAPLLAQDKTAWFGLDSLFFLSILFIFLAAIVTAVVTKWSRDGCLKFFRGDHVTLQRDDGRTVWGRFEVYSQGVEVEFPTPAVDRIGRRRSSVMIWPHELEAKVFAVLRYHGALDERQRRDRDRQVARTFNPNLFRRWMRSVRNFINTLRDAFSKALGAFIGQIARANPESQILTTQQHGVTQIGESLLGRVAGSAYEPMLEEHMGKPVILDVDQPGGGQVSFPGYLAEYTAKFIAIFNVEHAEFEAFSLTLPAEGAGEPVCVRSEEVAESVGCAVELTASVEGGRVVVKNGGFDPCVVETLGRDGFEPARLGATIPPKGQMSLPAKDVAGGVLSCRRVRRLDVVAPRSHAIVRHAGELLERRRLLDDLGLDELPLVPKRTRRGLAVANTSSQPTGDTRR